VIVPVFSILIVVSMFYFPSVAVVESYLAKGVNVILSL
jgi:hypothetical protein